MRNAQRGWLILAVIATLAGCSKENQNAMEMKPGEGGAFVNGSGGVKPTSGNENPTGEKGLGRAASGTAAD